MERNAKKCTFGKVLAVLLIISAVIALIVMAVNQIKKAIEKAKASGHWVDEDQKYFDCKPMDNSDDLSPKIYNDYSTTVAELQKRVGGTEEN